MNTTAPYPLNPNLSCVERVRTLFREIIKRRLIATASIRPGEFQQINDWIIEVQYNTMPIALFSEAALKDIWSAIDRSVAIREFIFGLCFEVRMRCFENKEDYDEYLRTIAQSVSQFNDQLSVIPTDRLNAIGDEATILELLSGNAWTIPIILLEQMDVNEIGINIALSAMETANERAAAE